MRFFSRRIHKAATTDLDTVEISEQRGVRYLHLGNATIQSAMRIQSPNTLELSYTQAMTAFLLFGTPASSALMVGLGGGSLAKFFYHQYPHLKLCAVDIHPEVIRAAYQFFELPRDESRLQVVQQDAAQFMPDQRGWDTILLDGYDAHFQVPQLASETFYRDCAQAMNGRGMLSVNLWGSDPRFSVYRERLERVFDGRVLTLPAEKRGNVIAFAFNDTPDAVSWNRLHQRAMELEILHRMPFTRFLQHLRPQLRWMGID